MANKKSIPELRKSIEEAEKKKGVYERELKIKEGQVKKLIRQERTHRLIQRGAILEKFLIDPGALSEDQVMEIVTMAFQKNRYSREVKEDDICRKRDAVKIPFVERAQLYTT